MSVKIDHEKCMHCGGCVAVCPVLAMELQQEKIKHFPEKCIDCGSCIKVCPVGAIKKEDEE